jgi:hypothetical protein
VESKQFIGTTGGGTDEVFHFISVLMFTIEHSPLTMPFWHGFDPSSV